MVSPRLLCFFLAMKGYVMEIDGIRGSCAFVAMFAKALAKTTVKAAAISSLGIIVVFFANILSTKGVTMNSFVSACEYIYFNPVCYKLFIGLTLWFTAVFSVTSSAEFFDSVEED